MDRSNANLFNDTFAQNNSLAPALSNYTFVGASGSPVMSGMFLDKNGNRTGAMFSASVSSGALSTFGSVFGAAIPSDAVGVIFDITGDVLFALLDASGNAPALATVQADGLLWASANNPFSLGRVS